MEFSDHTRLRDVIKKFQLVSDERPQLFAACPPLEPSAWLREMWLEGVPLASAIGTEKARSELIVAPLLLDLKHRCAEISLFSGVDFSVEPENGLAGVCDFLLSRSREQLFVTAPVVALVEAKNDSIKDGLGQCVAEMVASQIFNERENNPIPRVYGAVTTGTSWRFLSLQQRALAIDLDEYSIVQPEKILGILQAMVRDAVPPGHQAS